MTRRPPNLQNDLGFVAALALVCVTLLAPRRARAEVSLEWRGPEACADAGEVHEEIVRLLPEHGNSTVQALVEVEHEDTWRAHVHLEDQGASLGERRFEANSCEELRGAVALLIALAIDPDVVLEVEEPGERIEESVDAPDETGEAPEEAREGNTDAVDDAPSSREAAAELTAPEVASSPREPAASDENADESAEAPLDEASAPSLEVLEPAHWGLLLRGGVDVGALPSPSPVFALGGFFQRSRFALGVFAWAALPQDASTAVTASGRMGLGALRASPGLRLRYSRLALDLAGVVELGVMGGRGRDVEGPQTGYSLWAALGAEVGISLRVGPVSLGFRGDLRVPLNRPLYAFRGPLDVHRASSLVGRAEFALRLHFL